MLRHTVVAKLLAGALQRWRRNVEDAVAAAAAAVQHAARVRDASVRGAFAKWRKRAFDALQREIDDGTEYEITALKLALLEAAMAAAERAEFGRALVRHFSTWRREALRRTAAGARLAAALAGLKRRLCRGAVRGWRAYVAFARESHSEDIFDTYVKTGLAAAGATTTTTTLRLLRGLLYYDYYQDYTTTTTTTTTLLTHRASLSGTCTCSTGRWRRRAPAPGPSSPRPSPPGRPTEP